jgi:hypothetical protein
VTKYLNIAVTTEQGKKLKLTVTDFVAIISNQQ